MDPILWPDVAGFNLTGHLLLVARRGSESHNTYIKPTDPNSVDDRDIYAVRASTYGKGVRGSVFARAETEVAVESDV